MKIRCSRCGKVIEDNVVIRLESSVTICELTQSGLNTPYTNFQDPTSEMICKECFNEYCACLNQLNENVQAKNLANMVEVIDDIQYEDDFEDLDDAE